MFVIKIKDAASQSEIISFTTPHAGGLCDKYEYSASGKAHNIRERLNCSMLSILVFLFFLSVTTYAVILGLRYVVTTTNYFGEQDNCKLSRIIFNGWNFRYQCVSCAQGFIQENLGIRCIAESQH